MKTSQKKALLIIAIILLVSIANFFFPYLFTDAKHLIFIGISLVLLYFLLGINFAREANDKLVLRNMLIYILAYYLLIYLLGLLTGFVKTVYNYNLNNLLYNILPSILMIVGVELIRSELIDKTNKNKLVIVLSCITFIVFEVSLNFTGYNLGYKDGVYEFIGLLILVSLTKNILMSIIHVKTDYIPAIVYRLLIETATFILLIQPNLGPYLSSVGLIILPGMIGMMILNMNKTIKDSPKKAKKNSKLYLILVIILLVLVLLNSGLVKFHTLVIGSNSMKNFMEKGDVVLIMHLNNEEKKNVKVGEILVYRYDGKIICHRVTKRLKRDTDVYYKTKGDANAQEDAIVISRQQIMGKILLRFKYIGLPSVWLSELFN